MKWVQNDTNEWYLDGAPEGKERDAARRENAQRIGRVLWLEHLLAMREHDLHIANRCLDRARGRTKELEAGIKQLIQDAMLDPESQYAWQWFSEKLRKLLRGTGREPMPQEGE